MLVGEDSSSDGGEKSDPNLIEWNGDRDSNNPQNWSFRRKMAQTIIWTIMAFPPTFAGSIYSSGSKAVSEEFSVGPAVGTLGTSLYLLGNGFGPPIWGPLSEKFGRKLPAVFSMTILAIFSLGVATAQNVQVVMICRFFSGVFGIGPASCLGGGLTDIWPTRERGISLSVALGVGFVAVAVAPIIGNYIVDSHLGWRWTMYLLSIISFASAAIGQVAMKESFAPLLLSQRAARIRFETKNWAIRAKYDEEPSDFKQILHTYVFRPAVLVVTKPKLAFLTIYTSLVWGLLFFFFSVFPIAFKEVRGWSFINSSLPFLSELVGVFVATAILIVQNCVQSNEPSRVSLNRLPLIIVGSILLPIGLFWFAWTSDPTFIWIPQVLSISIITTGMILIYVQALNYIIDEYTDVANSAIAANTTVRALFGAGFPMFATPVYHGLGVAWATSLIGFVCLAMIPMPIIFAWKQYGVGRRRKGWRQSRA